MSLPLQLEGIMALAACLSQVVKVVAPKDKQLALRLVETTREQLHCKLDGLGLDRNGVSEESLTRAAHSALDRLLDAAVAAADHVAPRASGNSVLH
jgi:hypothetical protein